ncbi:MAG: hypothetical protein CFH32_00470 [Alphaproteobacteria bacterium MarineAlpha9_Bin2]|nr:MAG: hypothetical protein CFH32_00470 [Alphaproteobacteria bacterium MarineAlpha9_Bin2]
MVTSSNSSTLSNKWLINLSIICIIILFISLNTLSNQLFNSARIDLTQDNLYTLNQSTYEVIENIDEPITLRLFFSDKLSRDIPSLREYGQRVRELMEEYVVGSNGNIILERVDPEPFTDNEDLAMIFGLQGIPLSQAGEKFYFGLVASNSTDDISVIPYFDQSRESYLEYDLSRIINDLANPEKLKLGMASSLPIGGGLAYPGAPSTEFVKPWIIYERLSELFEVINLGNAFRSIPENIDLLMLVHPKNLDEESKYAIDQFIMTGKGVIFFMDPYSEIERNALPLEQRRTFIPSSNLNSLFKKYGFFVEPGMIVGDRIYGRQVTIGRPPNLRVTTYVLWMSLDKQLLNPNDSVTNELETILINTSGAIELTKDSSVQLEPLLTSSKDSMLIERFKIQFRPDPTLLLSEFIPVNRNLNLAARITGNFKSAYNDKIENNETITNANHIASSQANIIVFADTDILANQTWNQSQDNFGREVFNPIADNGSLIINAVEALSGKGELIALRSRGISTRPFIVVAELTRKAETAYRETEQRLQKELKNTEQKLRNLQRTASVEVKESAPILSKEHADTLKVYREQIINIRKKLRDVQRELRVDIEKLGLFLKISNIWLMPIIIFFASIIVFILRRKKRISHLEGMRNR